MNKHYKINYNLEIPKSKLNNCDKLYVIHRNKILDNFLAAKLLYYKKEFQFIVKNKDIKKMQNIDISIVTPVFNEENNIEPFLKKIKEILIKLTESYEIIFVMDPSSDRTENIIKSYAIEDKKIKLIKLSKIWTTIRNSSRYP